MHTRKDCDQSDTLESEEMRHAEMRITGDKLIGGVFSRLLTCRF